VEWVDVLSRLSRMVVGLVWGCDWILGVVVGRLGSQCLVRRLIVLKLHLQRYGYEVCHRLVVIMLYNSFCLLLLLARPAEDSMRLCRGAR
jgi:hypothetical protein